MRPQLGTGPLAEAVFAPVCGREGRSRPPLADPLPGPSRLRRRSPMSVSPAAALRPPSMGEESDTNGVEHHDSARFSISFSLRERVQARIRGTRVDS